MLAGGAGGGVACGAIAASVILLPVAADDDERDDVEHQRDDEQHEAEREGGEGLGAVELLSPTSRVTICTVTVVTASSGLAVRLAARPAAITTIMVSPMARETASRTPPTMPGSAAGSTTCRMVSDRVAPSASEPSRSACGTALITSSDSEETKGMIMTPMTRPAASALSEATSEARVDSPSCADERRDGQGGEEAVDHGRECRPGSPAPA